MWRVAACAEELGLEAERHFARTKNACDKRITLFRLSATTMGLLPCTRMLIKKNLENLQRWERKIRLVIFVMWGGELLVIYQGLFREFLLIFGECGILRLAIRHEWHL